LAISEERYRAENTYLPTPGALFALGLVLGCGSSTGNGDAGSYQSLDTLDTQSGMAESIDVGMVDAPAVDADIVVDGAVDQTTMDSCSSVYDPAKDPANAYGDPSLRSGSICARMDFGKVELVSQTGFNWADSWMMSWGADGKTYTNFSDGMFIEDREPRPKYSNAILTIDADPPSLPATAFVRVSADPLTANASWAHYIISTLVVGNTVYVGMVDFSGNGGIGRSDDLGKTLTYDRANPMWRNGPKPFVYPSFLQNGKGYSGNKDGFVYVYGSDGEWGSCSGKNNTLRLARAPIGSDLLKVGNYNYYDGQSWAPDITRAANVLADESNLGGMQSVVYNPINGRYFLITFGEACSANARMVVYDSPAPWGPWSRCGIVLKNAAVYTTTPLATAVYNPSFNAKWIDAADGGMWISYSSMLGTNEHWPSDYAFNLGKVSITPRASCP
jgi:hypothetical protein